MRPQFRKGSLEKILFILGVLTLGLGVEACGDPSSALEPEEVEAQEDPALKAILQAMEAAIQDEYKAQLIYAKVLDEFGPVLPFRNIIEAEARHAQALAGLFAARGYPVPESRWADDEIPVFPSVKAACQAGVVAEIENVEIYDGYLGLPLPDDVRFVFENNRAASLERHLPAFQRCS